jgi:hypothetical protein
MKLLTVWGVICGCVADVVFSTAHKAKGLEFNTGLVANDFNVCNEPRGVAEFLFDMVEDGFEQLQFNVHDAPAAGPSHAPLPGQ